MIWTKGADPSSECCVYHLLRQIAKKIKTVAEAVLFSTIYYDGLLFTEPNIKGIPSKNKAYKNVKIVINEMARTILGKHKRDKFTTRELLNISGVRSVNPIIVQQIIKKAWNMTHNKSNTIIKCYKSSPALHGPLLAIFSSQLANLL